MKIHHEAFKHCILRFRSSRGSFAHSKEPLYILHPLFLTPNLLSSIQGIDEKGASVKRGVYGSWIISSVGLTPEETSALQKRGVYGGWIISATDLAPDDGSDVENKA